MLMYHSELFHHVENFLKKGLGENKSQIFFIGANSRDRMAGGLVTSLRLGDQFCGAWR